MNKRPTFSIIIPVYNAENYLSEAVCSVTGQTFADFELLLVDDCSTDGTCALAQTYVERYKKDILKEDDRIIAERVSYVPQPQASAVVIDQNTGYVKAIVGGRGVKTASLTLNREEFKI